MSRHTSTVMILLCAVLLLGGCTNAKTTVTTPGSDGSSGVSASEEATGGSPEENAPGTDPSRPPVIGDDLTAGPWGFSVTAVSSRNEAPGRLKPASGKVFMYVDVSLANKSTATLTIKPEDFSMKDASGAALAPFGKRQAYNAAGMTPLEPGYSTNTTFIYEVAPGSTGYAFTFAPEVDGARVPLTVGVP